MSKERAQKIRHTIMRRIYWMYAVRLLRHPAISQGGLLLASTAFLLHTVSIVDIVRNIFATPVGMVPHYFWSALNGTELVVLLLLGLIVFAALSLRFTIKSRGLPMVRIV